MLKLTFRPCCNGGGSRLFAILIIFFLESYIRMVFLALNKYSFPTFEVPLSLLTRMLPGPLVIDERWDSAHWEPLSLQLLLGACKHH